MKMKFVKIIAAFLCMLTLIPLFAACAANSAVVMEYKGYTITEGMYLYWMKEWKSYYVTNYADIENTDAFWDEMSDAGMTNGEYISTNIQSRIRYYLIGQALFDQYGLKLSDASKEGIKADLEAQIEYYGSKSEYNAYLKEEYGINLSVLEKIYTYEEKYKQVYEYLYSTSGKFTASAKELDEYYQNYYVRVKYIMFMKDVKYVFDEEGKRVTDASGNYKMEDLTDEEKAEVKKNAESVLNDVKDGGNIADHFEKYMAQFGFEESTYPNGFYITADEYAQHTAEVTNAAFEMKEGEVRLVENDACYFVVQKFDLIDQAYMSEIDKDQFNYLVSYCNSKKFAEQFETLSKDIVINNDIVAKYIFKDL